MSSITKVAVAGATGNLGPSVVKQLLDDGFTVTVLTRQSNAPSFPSSVKVISVDYESLDSLTNALQGQEAVVSTLNVYNAETQFVLIEAAKKAGVQRFIPSEFGSDTLNPKTRALPVFNHKIAVQDALKKEAAGDARFTYTLINTGPFLDWGMAMGFVLNLKDKSVNLYDGGDRVFSTTSLPTIGKAVTGVLKQLEQTKNRAVYVHDTATTLKELAARAKKATGGAEGWTENVVSLDELVEQAWAEFKKDEPNPEVYMNWLKASVWGEGFGGHYEKPDNDLLGIREKSDAEIQALVESLV